MGECIPGELYFNENLSFELWGFWWALYLMELCRLMLWKPSCEMQIFECFVYGPPQPYGLQDIKVARLRS